MVRAFGTGILAADGTWPVCLCIVDLFPGLGKAKLICHTDTKGSCADPSAEAARPLGCTRSLVSRPPRLPRARASHAAGQIDREALGRLVFSDKAARGRLNAATHLPIYADLLRQLLWHWLTLKWLVVRERRRGRGGRERVRRGGVNQDVRTRVCVCVCVHSVLLGCGAHAC